MLKQYEKYAYFFEGKKKVLDLNELILSYSNKKGYLIR